MDIYKINDIAELIKDNAYVGRGIVIGKTADAKKAAFAYFIMGRSANSRNRVFVERDGALFTEPFDASKVQAFSIYTDETVPIKEVVQVMNIAKRNHYKVIMATSPE